RWRPETRVHTVVHLYRNGHAVTEDEDEAYKGRTQLFSEQLAVGNVSLRLAGVRLADEGDYLCMVEHERTIEQAAVPLKVTSLGTRPTLRLEGYHDDGILVQCNSTGWFPLPTLLWTVQGRKDGLDGSGTRTARDADGFYRISSSVEVRQGLAAVSCQVRAPLLTELQVSRIHIPDEFFPRVSKYFSAFMVFLVFLLIVLFGGSIYYYWKRKKTKELYKRPTLEKHKTICDAVDELELFTELERTLCTEVSCCGFAWDGVTQIRAQPRGVSQRRGWWHHTERLDLTGSWTGAAVREHGRPPVYRNGHAVTEDEDEAYKGRTQLFSEQLAVGNVSLRLAGVRLADEGDYLCMVEHERTIEQAAVPLKVTSLGARPTLRLEGYHDDGILVQCNSTGWFPLPTLLWTVQGRKDGLDGSGTRTARDADGFYRISSSVEVRQGLAAVWCQVRAPLLTELQVSRIHIPDEFFPRVSKYFSAFMVFLVFLLIVLFGGSIYYYWKRKKTKELYKRPTLEKHKTICDAVGKKVTFYLLQILRQGILGQMNELMLM
ncbi:butyrophilin-like protein 2, partial [Leucoraja erinacea]|uniref:butyrophilin-like protein 2 n=1 Tax=Leucoraja erinaceus TaxID=7782 RepID=UPI002457D012